ncbi:SMI1/KNR4 family protein [Mycobacterium camsae]|uniref:SMI1/KNR4 family protein n=1 Tax=Mycobacterium gordonae TaxID=1778 RepID=UPI0019817AAD|nr:SMI1/KNR4 family protein [Mycobacterium gordonae]
MGAKVKQIDFAKQFADLQSEQDELGLRNTAGLTDDEIAQTERLLGAKLPSDYLWFLQNYWTGMFGAVDLYTFDQADRSYLGQRQPPGVAGKFVAFADDGFGNAYCFPIVDKVCRDEVVIVPMLASEFTGNIEYDSFLDFLVSNA